MQYVHHSCKTFSFHSMHTRLEHRLRSRAPPTGRATTTNQPTNGSCTSPNRNKNNINKTTLVVNRPQLLANQLRYIARLLVRPHPGAVVVRGKPDGVSVVVVDLAARRGAAARVLPEEARPGLEREAPLLFPVLMMMTHPREGIHSSQQPRAQELCK